MLVPDHDQVDIDFVRELGDGDYRFADDHFTLGRMSGCGEPIQAIGQDVVVLLLSLFAFPSAAPIHAVFETDKGGRLRHDGDGEQFRVSELRNFVAIEQGFLAGFETLGSQQNTLVHGAPLIGESMTLAGQKISVNFAGTIHNWQQPKGPIGGAWRPHALGEIVFIAVRSAVIVEEQQGTSHG